MVGTLSVEQEHWQFNSYIYIVLISTKCVMIVTYCNGMSQLAIGHRMQHNVFGVHFNSYRLSAG